MNCGECEKELERIKELGQLIMRNSQWLYEETDKSHSNDELQMLTGQCLDELFSILGIDDVIFERELNHLGDRRRERKTYKKIYVNNDPILMTPEKWEKKILDIYYSKPTEFIKDATKDIKSLKHPDKFGNYSHFVGKVNMVMGNFNWLLKKYISANKRREQLRKENKELKKLLGDAKEVILDMNNQLKRPRKANDLSYPQKNKRSPLTKSIRHEVFVKDGFKCVECGATNQQTRLHVDHILPVAQGGTDELSNLQTLCEACNLAKSNRMWKGGTGESVEQSESDYDPDFMQKQYEIAREQRLEVTQKLRR